MLWFLKEILCPRLAHHASVPCNHCMPHWKLSVPGYANCCAHVTFLTVDVWEQVLSEGAARANATASISLERCHQAMGFVPRVPV